MQGPTVEERGAEPLAIGGPSDVSEATLNGRLVVTKTPRTTTTADLKKAHRVSGLAL
jgi:hypothetical protein